MAVAAIVVVNPAASVGYMADLTALGQQNMLSTSRTASAFQSIRPAKINFYLRGMRAMGFDVGLVLCGTDVTESTLQDRFTLIGIPDYIRIVSNMMEMSGDSALAFKLGGYLELGDLGVLGGAISVSQNFKRGMHLWQKYNRLFFGNLLSPQGFSEGDMQYFEYVPQVPLRPELLQFFMEEKIGVETTLSAKLGYPTPKAQYVSLTYSRPEHGNLYDKYCQQGVEFDAARNLFGTDHRDPNYSKRFESANEELLEVCLAQLEKVSNIADSQATFSPNVRQLIMDSLPDTPQVPSLADTFQMSTRTFCRNLAMEKTSYNMLLAEVREELAKNYLLTTTMSVDKIAQQLGFGDTGSLRKAFKQWTGSTMKQYREQVHADSM